MIESVARRPSMIRRRLCAATILVLALSITGCAKPRDAATTPAPRPTPCSHGGNAFLQSWRLCGERDHELITAILLVNELHFQYNLRNGTPYDIQDKGNGKHYFVDLANAKVNAIGDDSALFTLPLRSRDGKTYLLRWRMDGEFDKYLGSTPKIPLSRPAEPFHLKEVQPK